MSAPVIPVKFLPAGNRDVPTIEFGLKMAGGPGRLTESGLLDTGSHLTLLSEALLRMKGFPVHQARELDEGVEGLGGHSRVWYLEDAVVALRARDHSFHPVNLPRIHFFRERMVPIIGRDILEAFNATLTIDFGTLDGRLALG